MMKKHRKHPNHRHAISVSLLVVLLAMSFSFFISTLRPLEYRSDVQVLVLQQQAINFDPYTSAKSAEKIGQNFIHLIPTAGFLLILRQAYPELAPFSGTDAEGRKIWQEKTAISIFPETSILKISVFDHDPEEAEAWALAIAKVLETRGKEFHGGGEFVKLTMVDPPMTTTFPVKPNLVTRVLLGGLIGLIGAAIGLRTFSPLTWRRVFPWKEVFDERVDSEGAVLQKKELEYDKLFPKEDSRDEQFEFRSSVPAGEQVSVEPIVQTQDADEIPHSTTLLSYSNFHSPLSESAKMIEQIHAERPLPIEVLTIPEEMTAKQIS